MIFWGYESGNFHFDAKAYEESQPPLEIFTPAWWYANGLRYVLIECL